VFLIRRAPVCEPFHFSRRLGFRVRPGITGRWTSAVADLNLVHYVIGEIIEVIIFSAGDYLCRRWRFLLCLFVTTLLILGAHFLMPERVYFWPIAFIMAIGGVFSGILWDVRHIDKNFPRADI